MASISSLGTGSNLGLEDLLTKILDAERKPAENRLDLRETRLNASISAIGALKSSLAEFQTSLSKLKAASNFSSRTVVSSEPTVFTATATGDADIGSHRIEVIDLAKANKLASGNFSGPTATVGSGTLTIGVSGLTFNVEITAGVNDTPAGIRDAINNATNNTGVRASLLTVSDGLGGTATKLVLTANSPGAANQLSVGVTDSDGVHNDATGLSQLFYEEGDVNNQMSEVDPAQDARITLDGFTITNSTNVFTEILPGVTLTALKESDDPLETLSGQLTIALDKSAVKKQVETFVASYNALMTVFNQLTNSDKATNTRGLMSGDAGVATLEARLKRIIGEKVEGAAGDLSSLSFLGIGTNKDGSIKLDDAKLSAAINTRFDDVSKLFTGENGVAGKMDKLAEEFLKSGGSFQAREDSLQKQLEAIDDERDKLDFRLSKVEARYRAQFTALDLLVSQLNSTGDFLLQQLDATARIVNRDNS